MLVKKIVDDLKKITGQEARLETVLAVYEQVNKWLLSAKIQAEREKIREKRNSDKDGKDAPPTRKQLRFIEDLGGDPKGFKTKREASAWIEKHM